MAKVLQRNRNRALVVTILMAALFAVAYPETSVSRDAGEIGKPLTDSRAMDVDVGMLGHCMPMAMNCAFSTSGSCGSCGAAYGGQPCATYVWTNWPPGYYFTPAQCGGGAYSTCMPDPTSFTQCCTWTGTCCEVRQRCTTAPTPCACDAAQPPLLVGVLTGCYTGPWGPTVTPPPPCAGP